MRFSFHLCHYEIFSKKIKKRKKEIEEKEKYAMTIAISCIMNVLDSLGLFNQIDEHHVESDFN